MPPISPKLMDVPPSITNQAKGCIDFPAPLADKFMILKENEIVKESSIADLFIKTGALSGKQQS